MTNIKNTTELTFPSGIFQGKESTLRISDDKKWISAFDFIKLVGEQLNPRSTWKDIIKIHKNEIVEFYDNIKFPGPKQKNTPVINVIGIVKLLMWIPGKIAKQFRTKSAEILVRYLGGDISLLDEIKDINQIHIKVPNNSLSIFRESIKWVPSIDELNEHKRLRTILIIVLNTCYLVKCSTKLIQ